MQCLYALLNSNLLHFNNTIFSCFLACVYLYRSLAPSNCVKLFSNSSGARLCACNIIEMGNGRVVSAVLQFCIPFAQMILGCECLPCYFPANPIELAIICGFFNTPNICTYVYLQTSGLSSRCRYFYRTYWLHYFR